MFSRYRLLASLKRPYVKGWYNKDQLQVDLSGTTLTVGLPAHTEDPVLYQPCPSNFDLYNRDNFEFHKEEGKYAFGVASIFDRWFQLFGSPFKKPIGLSSFKAIIHVLDDLPHTMSCFNPVHFEQAIERSLHDLKGPMNSFIPYEFHNWEVLDNNVVYVEAHNLNTLNDAKRNHSFSSYGFYPLDERIYLMVFCDSDTLSNRDSVTPLLQSLAKNLISSIEIKLSSSCEELRLSTLKQTKRTIYQKPNLNWTFATYRTQKISPFESEQILVDPGSPFPKYHP
ncbi:hypothetical protein [Marinibactrum halimedae]|uniref:Uncharacterized protein n=1 Tax=Marinibactrum halimedae TaxID=1444977 RepID=A0AA37WKP8_9GAMM|nr:hypothetical protein [Marinibactrum halimedae]MCD9460717.1 hypothetical protein [Marinibactrum halimedae]GLS25158.1 hypothetical protein GCM10007877_08720 [Marinibactrum halimedae]